MFDAKTGMKGKLGIKVTRGGPWWRKFLYFFKDLLA